MPSTKKAKDSEASADAIELLKSQHREVEKLFEEIENTSDRASNTRPQLVRKLKMAIEAHAEIEEKFFYPAGREINEDMTLEAYEEHDVVRYLLGKITGAKTNDESFMARITVLKELIEHHVEEEEVEYFPLVQKKLGKARITELGVEMQEAYGRIMSQMEEPAVGATKKTASRTEAHV